LDPGVLCKGPEITVEEDIEEDMEAAESSEEEENDAWVGVPEWSTLVEVAAVEAV
jgi:hypothetical protein